MPITISLPTVKTLILDKSDKKYKNKGEPTTVTIRQARQAEHDLRMDTWALTRQVYDDANPGRVETIRNMSLATLRVDEVYYTLVGSNLVDSEGKEVFPSKQGNDGIPQLALTKDQFKVAWGRLWPDIADEIHEKVLEVNPLWRGLEGEGL